MYVSNDMLCAMQWRAREPLLVLIHLDLVYNRRAHTHTHHPGTCMLPLNTLLDTPCAFAINSIALHFTIQWMRKRANGMRMRMNWVNVWARSYRSTHKMHVYWMVVEGGVSGVGVVGDKNHFGFVWMWTVFNAFSARRECLIWQWYYSLCNPR